MSIIFCRDLNELRRTNAFRILEIVTAVITVAAAVGISIALNRQSWLEEGSARPLVELIMGLIVYFLPLLILIAFIWSFASLPIIKEKINGNIECLLATPLSPKAIWVGKILAIFLPAFGISILTTFIVVLTVNLTAISPATGYFMLPAPTMVVGLAINPLLFLGLLAFMVLFALANNPDIALAPSFVIGFGLMMGLPIGIATGTINLTSWTFALWYFISTAFIWVIVGYLSRMLSRENIVLSSKGD